MRKIGSGQLSLNLKELKRRRDMVAAGIARGMLHVHKKNLSHLDLSSRNVLLAYDWEPKIADFGLSNTEEEKTYGKLGLGTTIWKAPEIHKKSSTTREFEDQGKPHYNKKVDVFSYGVILWELFHLGHLPWEAELEVERRVVEGHRPTISMDCPKKWATLITACWDHNPQQRPDFAEILEYLERFESSRNPLPLEPEIENVPENEFNLNSNSRSRSNSIDSSLSHSIEQAVSDSNESSVFVPSHSSEHLAAVQQE
jgi:serine/threonine protein kinase